MRAGLEQLLAGVIQVFSCAQAHHGFLFADARATRMKLLMHVVNDNYLDWLTTTMLAG